MESEQDLTKKKCKPCEGGTPPLTMDAIESYLKNLAGWEYQAGEIVKTYEFKNYYETIAFVNATAWISHREDHHPNMELSYKRCRVRYSTHAIGGMSENDFICAAKIEALLS